MAKADLKPVRSEDEAKKMGAKGGQASGAARRRKRDMRERLRALLEGTRDGVTGADALAAALFDRALGGDVKAIALALELAGEGPRQTVSLSLPAMKSVADFPQVTAAILSAAAAGKIGLDEAQKLATLAGVHLKVVETAELESRLTALESAVKEKK